MTKFEDLCSDVAKLVGKKLCSVKPGSDLILTKFDKKNKTIEVLDKNGRCRTRPLSELQKIWSELRRGVPVHVDSALGGSGSSRNQPETVLANLPYVEWLSINGRKHLFLSRERTHELGMLKKMDSLQAQKLQINKGQKKDQKVNSIIVFNDIYKATQIMDELTSLTPLPISEGIYSIKTVDQHILLVSQKETSPSIPCASYPVLFGTKKDLNGFSFLINGTTYQLISILGNMVIYTSG